jgi:hypothetical protein
MSQGPRPSPPSDAAVDLARRLFAYETPPDSGDALLVAGAERVCARVADGLSRSFGPYGSLVLVGRALARAQIDYPSLKGVAFTSAQPPSITGLAESARANGAKAVAEGAVGMVATLTDAIGRLIGDDLAVKLLEQSITQSAGAPAVATNGVPQTVKEQ